MTWPRSPYWPALYTQVAFNADPNNPSITPQWTDLSDRVIDFSPTRGRQYELDQVQAGSGTMTLVDPNEDLNPANTTSPYWPNVKPYRQIRVAAVWPPAPAVGATNLMNRDYGADPGMERTAVGARPPLVIAFNVTPSVQTTNPWQGSRDLQWTFNTTSGEQGNCWTVPCVPGQTYTFSVYAASTAAGVLGRLFVNAGVGQTTFTTTTAYQRVTRTFTATAWTHQLWIVVGYPGDTVSAPGTMYLDGVQHEQGTTATAWNDPAAGAGQQIYPVFTGYVERWPRTWNQQGTYGLCAIQVVDALGVFAQQAIGTAVYNEIQARAPLCYWPLQDDAKAAAFAEASGNGGSPLIARASKYGAGGGLAAAQGAEIVGDPSGVAVSGFGNDGTGGVTQTGTLLTADAAVPGSTAIGPLPATPGSPWGLTLTAWVQYGYTTAASAQAGVVAALLGSAPSGVIAPLNLQITNAGTPAIGFANASGGATNASVVASQTILDGKWHHLAAVVTQNATNTTLTIYIEGVQRGTATYATSTVGWLNGSATSIQVGGLIVPGTSAAFFNGLISHVAVWPQALSSADIYQMSYVGSTGLGAPNSSTPEYAGDRITRYLGYHYSGPTAIEQGSSALGPDPATGPAGANLTFTLDAINGVVLSENGQFFAGRDGTPRFFGRAHRYLETTPTWVLGEQESPYLGDIAYDYDPTQVFNDVQISRTGGIVVHLSDTASGLSYFQRSMQREIQIASDLETVDAANYLLNRYRQPVQRIATLTLDPASNPALWPVVLGMELSDRVTAKRRTGRFTMAGDFFVEQLGHSIAFKDGQWRTSLQASPVDRQQVWILGDPTFGVLGTTTVLGY